MISTDLPPSTDIGQFPSGLSAPSGSAYGRMRPGEIISAYALVGPGLILLIVLFFLPVLALLAIALTDWQFGARTLQFVGIANFTAILEDPEFRNSFANTVVYVILVVPGTVLAGLTIALLIESGKTLRGLYRAVHFLPFMATLAAMSIAWEALLHPTVGLINHVLTQIGLPAENWLHDEHTVLPVLAAIGIWQNLGLAMVLFLAGLKAIPEELYDAADIDGADLWLDRLRTVTLPMLGPVMMFVVIIVALRAFEVFDTVQMLTQGGPGGASDVLLFTLYRQSFQYLRTGYGAALTVVFLVVVMALTLLQARIMDRKVHYS